VAGRGVRAFADGFVALLLPAYLVQLGFSSFEIGAIVTGTLLGSAALTLALGLVAHRFSRRRLVFAACALMVATGCGFAVSTTFWPILIVAVVGTMNPSAGDVSVFLPLEQALLPHTIGSKGRTSLFALYNLVGTLLGAFGSLAAVIPDHLAPLLGSGPEGIRFMFWIYAAVGVVAALLYRPLSDAVELEGEPPQSSLGPSRGIVYRLAALFSMDALGGGFFVQSLLALWLFQAFALSVATTAEILFWTNVCAAVSFIAAVPLARRIGLIRTMVFTHLPSNIFLMLVPFAPSLPVAIALLIARSLLSQMDVPTRSSYVMAVVTPAERPAAASITAVPRSLATAVSPLIAGYMLTLSSFGWPLLVGGLLKAIYDLLLLRGFSSVRPPEE
jgi:MFS family permease